MTMPATTRGANGAWNNKNPEAITSSVFICPKTYWSVEDGVGAV